MHSLGLSHCMQPRFLSLKPKRKLGLTIVPGTCEVARVQKGEAAYMAGVMSRWIIASIDGASVNPMSVQSWLKKIEAETEEKPWKIMFLKPFLKGSSLSKSTYTITRLAKMSSQQQRKVVYHSPRPRCLKPRWPKPLKKKEKLGRNERIVQFWTLKKLGFTLKEGTTEIERVTHDGVAYWGGVEHHWKILEICGEPVTSVNVELKLRHAIRVEGVFTIKFSNSHNPLIQTLKKILIKPISNFSMSIRQNRQSSIKRQMQVTEKLISRHYPLSIEPIEEETGSFSSSSGTNHRFFRNLRDF